MSMLRASWLLGAGLAGGLALPAPAQEGMKVETVSIPGNPLKFEMVSLPGGKFRMGSPPEEKGRDDDEGPVREVELRPFWMGKCEVSWAEFDEYFGTPKEKRADGVTHPTTGRQYLGMTTMAETMVAYPWYSRFPKAGIPRPVFRRLSGMRIGRG